MKKMNDKNDLREAPYIKPISKFIVYLCIPLPTGRGIQR